MKIHTPLRSMVPCLNAGAAVCRTLWAFALALGLQAGAEEKPATTYRNPVIAGDFADPSIIRVGDIYYAAGTSSEWAPHYPLYISKDLVNWEQVGHVFDEMPGWASASFWAPELFHHEGTFYVYYTARRKTDNVSVIGVGTTDDPRKGFTDRGVIVEWGSEAIDGFVFRDDDGTLYFSWKAYGLDPKRPIALLASEMTDDALGLTGEAFELLMETGRPISAEGQVLTKRGDRYYLFYSTKGCCGRGCDYQLEVARSERLEGPWEPAPENPILMGGEQWICPGHGTLVGLPDGRDYFLYHAYNAKDNVYTGRQGLLDEVRWSESGWPYLAGGPIPSATARAPLATESPVGPQDFVDRFEDPVRAPEWQWDFRHAPAIRFAEGLLHLGVSPAVARSPVGAFLGVRVQQGDFTLTASLDARGPARKGLAGYGDAANALGVRQGDGRLVVWKVEKGQTRELASGSLPEGAGLQLRMVVRDGHRYRFFSSPDGEEWRPVGGEGREFDGQFLPRWDRAPRVGLTAVGKPGDTARFGSVELRYKPR